MKQITGFINSVIERFPGGKVGAANKFEQRAPNPQNVLDIFQGRWASDLSDVVPGTVSGQIRLFGGDPRPGYALKQFGGSAKGLRILELGPLEGGHTYKLEKLGAGDLIAIEANVEAYLKCLITKELAGLKVAKFLLGDFVEYLRHDETRYDLIFCSGVLYHMLDPVDVIKMIAARTDRVFVWTHYYSDKLPHSTKAVVVERDGERYTYHQHNYGARRSGRFWGGNKPMAFFLSRADMMRAFQYYGLVNVDIHDESPDDPAGPCLSMTVWR